MIGSGAIDLEISRMSDPNKKQKVLSLYSFASSKVGFTGEIELLALTFQQCGMKLFDSIHLACAEYAHADVLFTTDKKFFTKSKQISNLHVEVVNPVNWLMEVTGNELTY